MALHRFQGHNSAGILGARSPPTVVSSRPHAPDALGPDLRPAPRGGPPRCRLCLRVLSVRLVPSLRCTSRFPFSPSHQSQHGEDEAASPPPAPPLPAAAAAGRAPRHRGGDRGAPERRGEASRVASRLRKRSVLAPRNPHARSFIARR